MNNPRRGATDEQIEDNLDELQATGGFETSDLRNELTPVDDENLIREGKPFAGSTPPVRRPKAFANNAVATSRAPRAKHFERLEQLMKEALDEGDDFSRDQAQAVLVRMQAMLSTDYEL